MPVKFFLQTLCFCVSLCATAQLPAYPKNYFRNPLGIPMLLSANFGELRPNHWHMGLDIRTNAKENYPIYAAAEGYIAKVGIRAQSFGRFIIINHPNGLSTLYAHLNDFFPELEEYVRQQQSINESWAVELQFTPDQFPVVKGDFIAYSGNTGGSRGPHLHFEIMDTKTEKRLNPLLFDFDLEDNMPPVLMRLAMYDRSRSIFEQAPQLYLLKKTDSGYIIPKIPVLKTGLAKVSFALQMIDKMNGGGSDNGVYSAKLFVDDEPQISFTLDSIDYDETDYINAHIDYKHDYNGGVYLQHISQLPGHRGVEFKKINGDGVLWLTDTIARNIRIDVSDTHGNISQLNFLLQHDDSLPTNSYDYYNREKLAPNRENMLDKGAFKVSMPETCLYDSVPVVYSNTHYTGYNAITEGYQFGSPSYPVHNTFTVSIKTNREVPDDAKGKLVLLVDEGKKRTVKKATIENGRVIAQAGSFGNFQAFIDYSPPSVNSPGNGDTINLSASSRIIFTPTDNYGVQGFKALLFSCASDSTGYHCSDDSLSEKKWLRFTNDKSRNWIYRFDENMPYGVHKLLVKVEDIVGNTTTREWWVKRFPYTPPPPKKKTAKKSVKKANEKAKKAVKKKK